MKFWYFDSQLKTCDLNRNYCEKTFVSKKETSKTDDDVDKPGTLFFRDEKIC